MVIQRASAHEQIKEFLIQRILDGTYKPGDRLVELQIADELKTSQGPVREAFRYLAAMRLIETEPYKGTRVRQITDKEMQDSSQVRAVLEELGGQLAASRLKDKIGALEAEAHKFMEAARRKDFAAYSQHDTAFHRIIMEAADNELLLNIWESVVLEGRFLRTLSKIGEEQLEEFAQAHMGVIDHLKAGDGAGAGDFLKNLICKYHGVHFC